MITASTTATALFPASESSVVTTSSDTGASHQAGTTATTLRTFAGGAGAFSLLNSSSGTTSVTSSATRSNENFFTGTTWRTSETRTSRFQNANSFKTYSYTSSSGITHSTTQVDTDTTGTTITASQELTTTRTTGTGDTVTETGSSNANTSAHKSVTYRTTSTVSSSENRSRTTTKATGEYVAVWSTTTTGTGQKTILEWYSIDTNYAVTTFASVSYTKHATGSSVVTQQTFTDTAASYTATSTFTGVFADEDEQLFILSDTGTDATGLPSAVLTGSASSFIVPEFTETATASTNSFNKLTLTNTLGDDATATETWTTNHLFGFATNTFSTVSEDTPATKFGFFIRYTSSTFQKTVYGTRTTTAEYFEGVGTTFSTIRWDRNGSSTVLGLYNEVTDSSARTASWKSEKWERFITTRLRGAGVPIDFSRYSVFTCANTVTRTISGAGRVQLITGGDPAFQSNTTRVFAATAAGYNSNQAFLQHPNSAAESDDVFAILSGDTRDFNLTRSFYGSVRQGVAVPMILQPVETSSTTVSFDSAANSVYETTGSDGTATDAYELTQSFQNGIIPVRTTRNQPEDWADHPQTIFGGPGWPSLPAVMTADGGYAYTLRDATGGTTSSHLSGNNYFLEYTNIEIPADNQIVLQPSAYWTREHYGQPYSTFRHTK